MFAHDSEGSDIDSDTNIDERPNQASSSRDVIDIEKELRALRTGSAFRHQADEIRRESKDAWNRLRSIEEDSTFVSSVASAFPSLPLVANLRCGAWYTPPELVKGTTYFKSTDGHMREWGFSLKRPNLHLVKLLDEHDGCIIVDSTRRGKSIPDALSKTIPIWISVLNRASWRKYGRWDDPTKEKPGEGSGSSSSSSDSSVLDPPLFTPRDVVSRSEHQQILDRIHGWVELYLASDLPIPHLRKPLKPLFLTPDSSFPTLPASPSFLPVLLVSASRYTPSRMAYSRQGGFTYIQGAGDDHEEWSQGLTPEIWWAHRERMLTLDRQALNEAILEAVGEAERQGTEGVPRFKSYDAQTQSLSEDVARIADTGIAIARRPTGHVFTQDELRQFTLIVHCSAPPSVGEVNDKKGSNSNASEDSTNTSDKTPNALVHSLGIPPGKRGVIDLYNALFRIVPLIGDVLNEQRSPSVSISISDSELEQDGKKRRKDVLICCRDGKDISVALAVAVLAVHFDDQKRLVLVHKLDSHRKSITKDATRRRLQWIITSYPSASPQRASLQRVNEYLMSRQRVHPARGHVR